LTTLTNSFADALAGFYAPCSPEGCASPTITYQNAAFLSELQLTTNQQELVDFFSGNALPKSAKPIAQAYAGHQFGSYNPQLGDGRALIVGELTDKHQQAHEISLKGSGRTPFSRGGDGKAALAPMLREVLISEFMYSMQIPTTRSLAVVTTSETVYRDRPLTGAILTRSAASHIRIGTFEFFARKSQKQVKKLADYCIHQHYAKLQALPEDQRYLAFLSAVCQQQASTIAQWMGVGFIHGVMNTDNMLISGETIDYGPCAFLDTYNPQAAFSSIDHQGRYAYQNQPVIAQWNLTRLAECLVRLFDTEQDAAIDKAKSVIEAFDELYNKEVRKVFSRKLGLDKAPISEQSQQTQINNFLTILQEEKIDFTIAFNQLTKVIQHERTEHSLLADKPRYQAWTQTWLEMIGLKQDPNVKQLFIEALTSNNPKVIPRNHLVEQALASAENDGDLTFFNSLLEKLCNPFIDIDEHSSFALPADTGFTEHYQTYCGT